jgi:hypothetical protein
MEFHSFGDHDLEIRDTSQQEFATCEIVKCRNEKLKKALTTKLHFGDRDLES